MYKCPDDGYILAEKYILCRTYAPKYALLYDTPIKDLLWLAETSLHWLWHIMMSNSDELKTG